MIVTGYLDANLKAKCVAAGMNIYIFADFEKSGASDLSILEQIPRPKTEDVAVSGSFEVSRGGLAFLIWHF